MFRALLLCALVVGVFGLVFKPPNYAQNTRDVRLAKLKLDQSLNDTDLVYTFSRKELHYLLLLGVVFRTAAKVANDDNNTLSVESLLLDSLQNEVPNVLEDPKAMSQELKLAAQSAVELLLPLLNHVEKACDDLADGQCNRVVDKSLQQLPELQKLSPALAVTGQAARNFLDNNKRLVEVALKFKVLPYLLNNVPHELPIVLQLAELLKLLVPQ